MKNEELEAITNSIQSKVGDEMASMIADDIGKLITSNTQTLDLINRKDKEIARLKDNNEKLVIANGNLLQSVSMGVEEKHQPETTQEIEKKNFNFRSVFDEKGHFKK
ncbi:MAG: hypothetical protein IIZ67_06235 [Bacilli bacterium]|nr:hypothetical protein [Bacilli bacterium]